MGKRTLIKSGIFEHGHQLLSCVCPFSLSLTLFIVFNLSIIIMASFLIHLSSCPGCPPCEVNYREQCPCSDHLSSGPQSRSLQRQHEMSEFEATGTNYITSLFRFESPYIHEPKMEVLYLLNGIWSLILSLVSFLFCIFCLLNYILDGNFPIPSKRIMKWMSCAGPFFSLLLIMANRPIHPSSASHNCNVYNREWQQFFFKFSFNVFHLSWTGCQSFFTVRIKSWCE